ncbi:apyrase-like isoform X2 [Plodia interpunctella]|uniref:apyrase-like isoform X2 n=1 Tax=Plodia interpunctella TaxID=58824 RepID=UPI0023684B36|nr:apyrase-like isoform X2 [Plodia interpunctella]
MIKFLILYFVLCVVTAQEINEDLFELNILHYNDFHARFVETSPAGLVCDAATEPCVGGFARLTTAVREAMLRESQSLLLNGGDSFQGTIWYNLLRWNVTQEFMNMLPHDAHVLGNHEFDNGISGVVPYLQYLKDPVVTANIIDDGEPTIQGLYERSIVVERAGRRIGIIGVIIATTNELASTGHLMFTDEVDTVRREAELLHDQGVDIIIVLSHCGLDIDRDIALNGGPYIDIVVGGHSHTLLYDGEPPDTSAFVPQGPYPVIVDQNGKSVLIVQAAAHTLYLGEIKLFFDAFGSLVRWEGNPHYIGNEIEQAPDVLEKVNHYLPFITEYASRELGQSLVHMSADCTCQECNLGSFICDAFLDSVLDMAESDNWHHAHFCVINQGGIRADIGDGVITYESLMLSTPFENRVEVFDLRGDHIMEMLEFSVANDPFPGARMLQVSGIKPVFDGALPVGSRVVDVSIRCIECEVPRYDPIDVDKYYRVVSHDFIGNGGAGYTMISENRRNVDVVGVDYDILMRYIERLAPVFSEVDGRIHIDNPCLS